MFKTEKFNERDLVVIDKKVREFIKQEKMLNFKLPAASLTGNNPKLATLEPKT